MTAVIAVHGLTKRFGGKTAVQRLDLAVFRRPLVESLNFPGR